MLLGIKYTFIGGFNQSITSCLLENSVRRSSDLFPTLGSDAGWITRYESGHEESSEHTAISAKLGRRPSLTLRADFSLKMYI